MSDVMVETGSLQSFHITFCSDLTRAEAPSFPLGFLMEANWRDEARWLGLLGRSALETRESTLINFETWPELRDPYAMLSDVFECGWDSDWGHAAAKVSEHWRASALVIENITPPTMPDFGNIADDAAWERAKGWLVQTLNAYVSHLQPMKPTVFPARPSLRRIPHETRSREGFKLAA